MPRFPRYRILMTALVLLLLTVPSVHALGPDSHRAVKATGFSVIDLFGRAWNGLVSLWMENGCIADPNGGCATGQAEAPRTDNGCIADPSGGCAAGLAPQAENGCIMDPDGRCRSGS